MRRRVKRATAAAAIAFVLAQVVPYGRDHDNPPVAAEPNWNSSRTRALAVDACYSCHSNETHWPWYSNVAPASWLVQHDVDRGRASLNFSEFDSEQDEADKAAETVAENEMPPFRYTLSNPEARLNAAETRALIQGLAATFGGERGDRGSKGNEGGEHRG